MSKFIALTLMSAAISGAAFADTIRVQTTDFSGKPPFKRSFETLDVKDVAQFDNAEQMVTVQTTDFSGKPPFKRNVETLEVRDVAEFSVEEMPTQNVRSTSVNKKPPFKR